MKKLFILTILCATLTSANLTCIASEFSQIRMNMINRPLKNRPQELKSQDTKKIKASIHVMRLYGYKRDADILTKNKRVKIIFKDLAEVVPAYSEANAITSKNLITGEATIYINKKLRNSTDVGLACLLLHESQHIASATYDTFGQEAHAIEKEVIFYLAVLEKDSSIQNKTDDILIRRLNSIKDSYDWVIKNYITQDACYRKLLNIKAE